MKLFYSLFIFFVITSCASGLDIKPIPLEPLFHDMNSKVWMIDQVVVDGKNYSPNYKLDKDILVFYASGKCLYQPMRTIGDFVGKQGIYVLYNENKKMSFYFEKEKWDFTIAHLSEDTLVLDPTKESDLKYRMVLVPFPEL